MTLRVPDELDPELRAAAEAAQMSINSFVVDAIKERLAALHHESVMAIARDVVSRDAEILDRLAKA
ncbi:toxin-antitoxin system HicB family antitoxin [Amycolatopsis cynarae]